jgi:uncharacterized membrane protein
MGTATKPNVFLWLAAALAIGTAIVSYRYLVPGQPGAIPNILANRFANPALIVHVAGAATALLLGPLQFFGVIRRRWPRWHRRIGTVYVLGCLVGGLAGLALALGSTSGPIASAGFGALAVAWLIATATAWRFARARDFVRHRRWMIRSFALALAAVTLRIYLPIAQIAQLDFHVSYVAISFLCWVPNLIAAELYLALWAPLRTSRPLAAPSQSPG